MAVSLVLILWSHLQAGFRVGCQRAWLSIIHCTGWRDSTMRSNRTNSVSHLITLAMVCFSIVAVAEASAVVAAPTPPKQATKGPGSSDYAHQEIVDSVHGKGVKQFRLFEPAKPTPKTAPVIVFNHGYGAVDPVGYGQWIEHIVKRGNIVIYPRFQAGLYTASRKLTPNAIAAVKDALVELKNGKHVSPDVEKFAIVGHSAGGIISANMAATWKKEGLPKPRAVMCVLPGISRLFGLADMKQLPADVLLLTVATDRDVVTGDADAKRICRAAVSVPKKNKDFVLIRSDTHGQPSLIASHLAPIAVPPDQTSWKHMAGQMFGRSGGLFGGPDSKSAKEEGAGSAVEKTEGALRRGLSANAVDYYGFWKLFDGLCDAAFHNRNRQFALGNTEQQRFMGKWSDGTPVKPLVVSDP